MPIIRPPRWLPNEKELKRSRLYAVTCGTGQDSTWFYDRRDLQLKNSRGHLLQCSHFLRCEKQEQRRPCVIYLHGNSSCRLEVQNVLEYLLQYDVSVFSFDFSGSGQSEGEYVSLGYHEEQDLRVVIDYLRRSRLVDSIALWGWSMGAVTAILRAAEDPLISACVLDSPFADFRVLAGELARSVVPTLPEMLNGFAFGLACDEACSRAGFNPGELRPVRSASKASVPALFCVANGDTLTAPHHTTEVHAAWQGEKQFVTFHGDHTSDRPSWFLEQAAKFLWDHFQKDAPDQQKRRPGFFSIFPVKADGEVAQMIRNCQPVTICNFPKKDAPAPEVKKDAPAPEVPSQTKALTNKGPLLTFEKSAQPLPIPEPSCLCSKEIELEEPPPIPDDDLPSLPPKLSSQRIGFPFFRNESVVEI